MGRLSIFLRNVFSFIRLAEKGGRGVPYVAVRKGPIPARLQPCFHRFAVYQLPRDPSLIPFKTIVHESGEIICKSGEDFAVADQGCAAWKEARLELRWRLDSPNGKKLKALESIQRVSARFAGMAS